MGHGDSRFHGARQPIIRECEQPRLGAAREPTQESLRPPPHGAASRDDFLDLRRSRRAFCVRGHEQQTAAIRLDLFLHRRSPHGELSAAVRGGEQGLLSTRMSVTFRWVLR